MINLNLHIVISKLLFRGLAALLLVCASLSCEVEKVNNFLPEFFLFHELSGTSTQFFSNIQDRGRVETGLLLGTATGALAAVEVQLDGGEFTSAEGTDSWSYQLPTGSDVWKLNSTHTIGVRARNSLGQYTATTTITVSQGLNKDINGDGYSELLVSDQGLYDYNGNAYIYFGASNGINSSSIPVKFSGLEDNDSLGYTMKLGDMNADGYADLIIGGFQADAVYIYPGSAAGISDSTDYITLTAPDDSEYFGSALALGDLNGDGYLELAVGGYYSNNLFGGMYIYSGGPDLLDSTIPVVSMSGESDLCHFGNAIAMGDINGDGNDDLVVASRNRDSSAGGVYVYLSNAFGISNSTVATLIPGSARERFGEGINMGDLNNDGYSDLVVGTGDAAYIYLGSANGMSSGSLYASLTSQTTNSGYGYQILLEDVNVDGYLDLFVGEVNRNNYAGGVYFYPGSADGIDENTGFTLLSGESPGERFGASLGLGDFNGDGFPDLVIGASGQESNSGKIKIYNGNANGPNNLLTPTIIAEDTTDYFGQFVGP